jgi:formylglycine-generating enzyme required for sulfatase activity
MKIPSLRSGLRFLVALASCLPAFFSAKAADPAPSSPVSNVTFAQRTDGSKLVDISYTLTGGSSGISLAFSVDGGTTYSAVSSATGDVGPTVSAGTAKQIVWDAGTDYPNAGSDNVRIRVTPLLAGAGGSFAPIPGGTYQIGNLVGDSDITNAGTVSVTLSPYSMSVHDTSEAQWDAVHSWATSNGYSFTGAVSAKASNHPVVTESWDDVVKWANAASEQDALTPCYKVGGAVYRTGVSGGVTCDWTASGYRLPTEAEWEVAARGGLSGKRFPWGDTISHSQANYKANINMSYSGYDLSALSNNYHPVYAVGNFPYTSPVGSFAANGYGLYDMAGNVLQWCWDWYGGAYSPEIDPKGASTGWTRVLRGGRWSSDATDARCAMRVTPTPSGMENRYHGFRLARGRSSGVGSWTESAAGFIDTASPVLSGVPVSASATSASGASVMFSADTATDNLGTPTVTHSPASGSLFPIGTSTVTVTATDGAGNMSTGTFAVTVNDTTAPVLTLPSNVTAQATSAAGATVNYPAATATDAVTASPTISYSQASGTVFPLGTTTVTVSATDGAGNVSTGTFTVTVNDTTAPVLTLPSNVTAQATSAAGATVNYAAATATDAVTASPAISYSQASGTVFALGTTTVTVSATDGAGNVSSGTSTVTVNDTTAPVLTLPSSVTAQATSAAGATVNYPAATATDIVTASPKISYSQASGTVFALGTTTVTVSATDGAGNVSTGTFTVTVNDTTAPVLMLPSNVTAQATGAAGATVHYAAATATDAVTASPSISYSQASGTVFPLGTTTVTVSATDGAGNVSTGTFTVTVNDTTAPVLTLPSNVTAQATSAAGATVHYAAATATDAVTASPSISHSQASGTVFPLGTTMVTVSATDGAANVSAGTFTVTVNDTTAPVLTLPSNVTAQATSAAGATVNYAAATATDAVTASPAISHSQASGTVFPLGTTMVTVSATDGVGNVSTGTFTVTVNDTTAPVLTLPSNVTAQATSAAGAAVNYAAATATDIVTASPTISYSQASGTVFRLGTTTVTVSATDGAGTVSTGTFTVTVNDTTAPVLTLPSNMTVIATAIGGVVVNYPAASAVDAVSPSPVITYSQASGAFFPLGTTTVTVTAKDAADNTSTGTFTVTVKEAASLSFSAAEYPCIKGAPEVVVPVTVRRLNDSAKAVVVEVTPGSDTLQSGDYALPASPMVLRWGAGDGSDRTFPVLVRAGRTAAGASIRLNLRNLEGAEVGDIGSAMVVLNQRDPGMLMFAGARLERAKPATGDLAVNLVVQRAQGSTGAVSAEVVVAGGTARPGDFTVANPVRLEWADGDTADKTFPVVFRESAAVPAAGKTIQFKLQNLSGGVTEGGVSSTTLVVFSSTMPGTLNFSSATYEAVKAPNGHTLVPITVNREQGGKGAVKVQVAPRGGSASADVDFALPSSPVTLNWADNELGPRTFNVVLKETAQIASGGETVLFRLQAVEGGAEVGRVSACTVTFSPSDTAAPVLVVESPANRSTVTGESVLIKGTATDVSGVTRVEVTLNSEDPEEAVLVASSDGKTFRWMTTLVPEQGVNTVQVQAFDGSGNDSAKLTQQFTFRYARPGLAGTFDGRLEAATDKAQLAVEESEGLVQRFVQTQGEGLLTATVSVTGAFTGKLTTRGTTVAFKGVLRRDGVAWFDSKTDSLEVAKGQGAGRVVLGNLSLRAQETGELPRLVGELMSDSATFGTVSAERFVYSSAPVLPAGMQRVPVEILDPASENGRYTALFEPRVDEGTETNGGLERTKFPQSSGYARVAVASSGVVSVTGRLADGTAVSYSNRLSPSGAVPVYVPLYTGRGFLAGTPVFDASQPDTDLAGAQLRWVRPSGLPAPFTAGWEDGITVNLVGAKYVPVTKPTRTVPVPANPYTVFGPELAVTALVADEVPDFVRLRVEMAGGGLAAGTTDEGQLLPGNVFKVTAPGAAGLKLVFTPADGGFTGSFTHPLGSLQPIAGVVLQKTKRAAGGFLFLPPKGSKAPAAAGSVEATVP